MNIKEQIKHVRALAQALGGMENCKLLRDIDPIYYDSACAGFGQEYRDKVQLLVNSLHIECQHEYERTSFGNQCRKCGVVECQHEIDTVIIDGIPEQACKKCGVQVIQGPCDHEFVSVGETTVCAKCGCNPVSTLCDHEWKPTGKGYNECSKCGTTIPGICDHAHTTLCGMETVCEDCGKIF